MTTATRDRLPILIPLGMMGLLGAVFVGVTLARTTQQTQPATTTSPSPASSTAPAVSPSPAVSIPVDKTINTGAFVRIKGSSSGCQPAFDSPSPDRQQTVCLFAGQSLTPTGQQQNGLTELKTGENKIWMLTETLEPTGDPTNATPQNSQQDQNSNPNPS